MLTNFRLWLARFLVDDLGFVFTHAERLGEDRRVLRDGICRVMHPVDASRVYLMRHRRKRGGTRVNIAAYEHLNRMLWEAHKTADEILGAGYGPPRTT